MGEVRRLMATPVSGPASKAAASWSSVGMPAGGRRWATAPDGHSVLRAAPVSAAPRRAVPQPLLAAAMPSVGVTAVVTFAPAAAITLVVLAMALNAAA